MKTPSDTALAAANLLRAAKNAIAGELEHDYRYHAEKICHRPELIAAVAQVIATQQVAEAAENALARIEAIEDRLRDIETALRH